MLYTIAFALLLVIIFVAITKYKSSTEFKPQKNSLVISLCIFLSVILTIIFYLHSSLIEDSRRLEEWINYYDYIHETFEDKCYNNPELQNLLNENYGFLYSNMEDLNEKIEEKAFLLYFG